MYIKILKHELKVIVCVRCAKYYPLDLVISSNGLNLSRPITPQPLIHTHARVIIRRFITIEKSPQDNDPGGKKASAALSFSRNSRGSETRGAERSPSIRAINTATRWIGFALRCLCIYTGTHPCGNPFNPCHAELGRSSCRLFVSEESPWWAIFTREEGERVNKVGGCFGI